MQTLQIYNEQRIVKDDEIIDNVKLIMTDCDWSIQLSFYFFFSFSSRDDISCLPADAKDL